jgi:hypothetical protein
VDREAIARSERRRQATDELESERDRAAQLHDEVVRLVVELEGPRLDEEVFARLSPDDVELVRGALQGGTAIDGTDREWFELDGEEDGDPWQEEAVDRDEVEAEIARLREEIAESTRRQEAFVRYLEALG